MRLSWFVLAGLTIVAACSQAGSVQQKGPRTETTVPPRAGHVPGVADLHRKASDVRWDEQRILRDDFDCDDVPDVAVLGHRHGAVVVGLSWASSRDPDLMEFAISGTEEMAVCAEPAKLTIESLEDPDEELDGFKPSRTCKGLRLEGGECDPVHIYWNHSRKLPGWWRN